MDGKKNILFKNTVMLYIMTISTYVFALITVPYQTRILGPEIYGKVGFAQSLVVYFQLLLDFGFILSATEDVSKYRDQKDILSEIFSSVIYCKLLLGIFSLILILCLCFTVPVFRDDVWLYILFYLSILVTAFLPDFLYRGLEKMSIITYRTVAIRLFFTLAIFLFLKSDEQYYLIPILNTIGTLGACVWIYWDIYHNLGIRFVPVSKLYLRKTFTRSASYFISRIASTIYSATNTFILGLVYPNSASLGYYTSAEKLMTTAQSAFNPISDSLYPYMVRNKDFHLIKKVLLIAMPVIVLSCTIVGIFADDFCALFFGEDFRSAGSILRLLLPIVVMTLPIYLLGFPVLSPLGLSRYANLSTVVGAVVQVILLILLVLSNNLTVEAVCIITCITHVVILGMRIFVIVRKKSSR